MNTCRSAAGAAMLGGDIYVVGEYMFYCEYIYMCRQVVCRWFLRNCNCIFNITVECMHSWVGYRWTFQ